VASFTSLVACFTGIFVFWFIKAIIFVPIYFMVVTMNC